MKKILFVIYIVFASMISGCATNSMTGRSQLMIVSESAAITKSSKLYSGLIESYDKQNKVISDPAINSRIQLITNRLVEQAILYRPDSQKWQWQVNVIENPVVNASCMPGGKMVVFTGLLDKIQPTDDELAEVMGHEISHALANHGAEKMSVQLLGNIAMAAVGVAAAAADRNNPNAYQRNQNQKAVNSASALAAAAFITLPNSRGAETEADKLGIELAARAGYDPAAAISIWNKMMLESGDKSRGDFMKTHPSPPKRIEAFETLQEPMRKIYDERKLFYVDYKPAHQYVSVGTSSNERVVTEGESLTEATPVDASKALAFYSPEYESFKQGTMELSCKSCSLKFYLSQSELKTLYEKQDWRGLVQNVIKTGYEFDLAYYYLAAASKGMGLVEPSKIYFRKAKELSESQEFSCLNAKMIKCNGIDVAAISNEQLK